MFKKFLSYYKPHKKILILDMLASLSVALLGIIYPIVTRYMLNDLIPNKQYTMIIIAGASLFLLYFIRMLLNYFIQYKGHMMGVHMQGQMRSEMFRHLEKLPFSFYDNNETGQIMSRMTSDLNDIAELAHHGPENFLITGITIIVSFTYLATINIWLTLIIFACVPILVIVSLTLRKRMRSAFRESQAAIAKINANLQSSIAGIRVTKAFNNSDKETEKFEEGNSQFMGARKNAFKAMGQFHSVTSMITDIFNVVVLISGGLFLYGGMINFADYSTFIISINLFLGPVNTLIRFMEQFQNGVAGFERYVDIMNTKPEMDSQDAKDVQRLKGDIEFKNVSSTYSEGKEILKNISFSIEKGKTFALVGPSGGGKTTLCHLIPAFYKITDGEIYIDNIPLKNITMKSLRENIGIVQQDIYLFNSSIRDNILYGKLDATEEEVITAAKMANIHEYIMSLENGYDTVIGERGVRLSGGQKQRLCIARVFLKNPPILILDEATSALDNATEIQIQKALDELSIGRTTIVVAHRLSTIKNADEIAVVDNGEITEQGTHEELLALNGTYAQLYKQQFREIS